MAPTTKDPDDRPFVLLAEDMDRLAKLIATVLSVQGCRVLIARDGEEALYRAHQERPSVIVTDIQMPGMNGLDLIRHLRETEGLSTVPIIVLTGHADAVYQSHCLKEGAAACLQKPVAIQELLRVIQAHSRRAAEGHQP
jgi:DNA-binding response OmpR family regulator